MARKYYLINKKEQNCKNDIHIKQCVLSLLRRHMIICEVGITYIKYENICSSMKYSNMRAVVYAVKRI